MRASDHLPLRYNAAQWFIGRHAGGNRVALVTDDATLTSAELDLEARRFAGVLRDSGVHRGDRVAFILPDSPLLSAGFWGAIALGAVAVPINTLLKPELHRRILEDCEARVLVSDAAVAPPECRHWTAADAAQRIAAARPLPEYAKTHRDSFAFFLYTSGTTGEPK